MGQGGGRAGGGSALRGEAAQRRDARPTSRRASRPPGTSLFPAAENDLQTDCSCPDWANPCKHTAAVHYLLGERFDADPFLIFVLRGRTREAIVEALRARRAGGSAAAGETPEEPPAEAPEDTTPPLAESLGAYWSSAADLADLAATFDAPPLDALPVKRLGPAPFWQGPDDFEALMEDAYQAIGAHAYHLAMGDESGERKVARAPAGQAETRLEAIFPWPVSPAPRGRVGLIGGDAADLGQHLVDQVQAPEILHGRLGDRLGNEALLAEPPIHVPY